MATPRNQSVFKAFAMLKSFRDPAEWLTSSELSRRSNLPEASGYRLIQTLDRGDFDVILSDLGLPDMPGDVLIRQIVAGARRRARVIVVTGYGEPYLTRARQAGADVVFTKPVEWAQVLEAIDKPDLAASA